MSTKPRELQLHYTNALCALERLEFYVVEYQKEQGEEPRQILELLSILTGVLGTAYAYRELLTLLDVAQSAQAIADDLERELERWVQERSSLERLLS